MRLNRRLPRICLGRRAGSRANLIQGLKDRRAQLQFKGLHGKFDLFDRTRSNDRRGDCLLMQEPGKGYLSRLQFKFGAIFFVRFDLALILTEISHGVAVATPPCRGLGPFGTSGQHAAHQGAPRDQG
jgi:hypothetical protein